MKKSKLAKEVEKLQADGKKPKKKFAEIPDSEFLSTGVTLLNLAMTGRKNCGYKKGTYINTPGASDSGKSFLILTAFAEACKNPEFDNYELVYNNAEGATPPPIKKYFGSKVKERLKFIEATDTVEDFHEDIQARCQEGPCIYLLDSSDALTARSGDKADEAGKGSMGTEIAKAWAKGFRKTRRALIKSKSILIIISQTRQNIGFGAQFNPDTRSGGNALKFFARIEMWLKTIGALKAGNRKDRTRGKITKVKITKNHYNGWNGTVRFYLDNETGIDDLRGCIEFLVEEKTWAIKNKVIDTKDFGLTGKIDSLIQQIEFSEREEEVRDLVANKWIEIERSIRIDRKKRYE